jgi:DNA polymerase-3 subunit alpha
MVQELRTIMTKKGKQMGFAKLADFKGTIDITFFPQVWEQLREKVQTEGVYAFKGKVDGSRDTPSFLVDTMEDPAQLQEKAISSVHIQMQSGFSSVKEINSLKDFLFGGQGNCYVYFHIDVDGVSYIVKANSQMTAPSSKDFLQAVRDLPLVQDVWCE